MVATILEEINQAKKDFGVKCPNYVGSLTVEIIRDALSSSLSPYPIKISQRDVFIRNVPLEIDLLCARKNTMLQNQLLFEPNDVFIVLEIKNYGSFDEQTINRISKNFRQIKKANPQIECYYVTLTERKGYKWTVTEENLGFPVFTLFWRSGSGKNEKFDRTADWERLLDKIKQVICNT